MLGGWPVALWDSPTQLCYSRNGDEITVKGYAGQGALVIGESLNGGAVTTIQRGHSPIAPALPFPRPSAKSWRTFRCRPSRGDLRRVLSILIYTPGRNLPEIGMKTTLIQVPAAKAVSYTIPATVTQIGDLAFTACSSLTSVLISNGVTRIGNRAFHDCSALTTVTIPASVTQFGASCFGGCTNLRSVYFLGNVPLCMGDVAFYGTPTIYYLPGTTRVGLSLGRSPTAAMVAIDRDGRWPLWCSGKHVWF